MYEAHINSVREEQDAEMQRTSWFTSLLMNATGNFKTKIKPDRLYTPLAKQKSTEIKREFNNEYVENMQEELKRKFNID